MVRKLEAEVGPVDVLVNNAGITRDAMFRKMDKGQWDAVLSTNLDQVFNVTHQVLTGMAERGWGRVINISSVNGVKGQFGQANYSAAKAGILGFTKAHCRRKWRRRASPSMPSLRAISAPTWSWRSSRKCVTRSSRTIPMGRLGKPEEIGAPVRLSGVGPRRLHDGCDAEYQWRPALLLTVADRARLPPAVAGVVVLAAWIVNDFRRRIQWPTQSRLIKKYPNRRLYDTRTSTYITLADVKELVLAHEDFQVVDAKSGEDLTRSILLQIILEEEAGGAPMFTSRPAVADDPLLRQCDAGHDGQVPREQHQVLHRDAGQAQGAGQGAVWRNAGRRARTVGAVPQVSGAGHAAHDGHLRRAEPEDVPADAGHHAGTDAQDVSRLHLPSRRAEDAEKK